MKARQANRRLSDRLALSDTIPAPVLSARRPSRLRANHRRIGFRDEPREHLHAPGGAYFAHPLEGMAAPASSTGRGRPAHDPFRCQRGRPEGSFDEIAAHTHCACHPPGMTPRAMPVPPDAHTLDRARPAEDRDKSHPLWCATRARPRTPGVDQQDRVHALGANSAISSSMTSPRRTCAPCSSAAIAPRRRLRSISTARDIHPGLRPRRSAAQIIRHPPAPRGEARRARRAATVFRRRLPSPSRVNTMRRTANQHRAAAWRIAG